MFCIFNKKSPLILIIICIVSILFSLFVSFQLPPQEHNLNMLMGMITGASTGVLVVAVVFLIRRKVMPQKKIKEEEFAQKDERNIMIRGKAFTISSIFTAIILIISAFVLVGIGYRTPAYVAIGAVYIQLLSLSLAQIYFQKKL